MNKGGKYEDPDSRKYLFWDITDHSKIDEDDHTQLYKGWRLRRKTVPEYHVVEKLDHLLNRLPLEDSNPTFYSSSQHKNRKFYLVAFIALCLLITSSYYFFILPEHKITITTHSDEEKVVLLPDSSSVVLNTSSTLSYYSSWNSSKPREIWLEGEAYFDIRNYSGGRNFRPYHKCVIHTSDVTVEVLGTQLNIRDRDGDTQVELKDGKVKLQSKLFSDQNIYMKPGDRVSYSKMSNTWIKKEIEQTEVASWKDSLFHFVNIPVSELAQEISDLYNIETRIEGEEVGDRKLTIHLPVSNLDILLKGIASALKINIAYEKSLNLIIIKDSDVKSVGEN